MATTSLTKNESNRIETLALEADETQVHEAIREVLRVEHPEADEAQLEELVADALSTEDIPADSLMVAIHACTDERNAALVAVLELTAGV